MGRKSLISRSGAKRYPIANIGTCGTGLDSLKKANHAILFDLPFDKSDSKQACSRV